MSYSELRPLKTYFRKTRGRVEASFPATWPFVASLHWTVFPTSLQSKLLIFYSPLSTLLSSFEIFPGSFSTEAFIFVDISKYGFIPFWINFSPDAESEATLPSFPQKIEALYESLGNKAKEWISKQVFQENKARQSFRKMNISYPLIVHVCVSGGKKFSFFGKFGVLCFFETPVLRFALFPLITGES